MGADYHQFCAIARALELVGERWTLLLVRELLLRGPLPAAAIARGLPDVPPNQLAERLIDLEAAGLVVAGDGPPNGALHRAYSLTATGRQLEGIVDALAEFGLTCLDWPRSPAEAVLPLRVDGDRARALRLLSLLQRRRSCPADPPPALDTNPARAAAG